jgi:hypothetical protein
MNSLERKLRSWQPRRPSAMLKFKLAAASGNLFPRAARFASWLVPVAACVLLAVVNLNSQNNFSHVPRPLMAMSLSNQNYAAYWNGFEAQGENSPSAHIFKWTNDSASISNMRFLSPGN